jgi:hypothetical protein
MNCLRQIFAALVAAAAMVSGFAVAQLPSKKAAEAKAELSVLTSHEGDFQLKYPQSLTRCERMDAENPDVWSPPHGCAAAIPVCDNSGHSGEVEACVAYSLADFRGSELQAAALAVSRLDGFGTPSDCTKRWASRDVSDVHSERIGALTFQVAKAVESQTSYVSDHAIYRVFHGAACFELAVNISIALPGAFAAEDVPRKLTDAEREEIKASLMQAIEGFRFLK